MHTDPHNGSTGLQDFVHLLSPFALSISQEGTPTDPVWKRSSPTGSNSDSLSSLFHFSQCSSQLLGFHFVVLWQSAIMFPKLASNVTDPPVSVSQVLVYSTYSHKLLYVSQLCDSYLLLFRTCICFFLVSLCILFILSFHSFEHILKVQSLSFI